MEKQSGNRVDPAFILLVLLALLPGPLVWAAFYLGHDFVLAVGSYAGLCMLIFFLYRDQLKAALPEKPFALPVRQIPRLALKIGLMLIIILAGWQVYKPWLIDWPHFMTNARMIRIEPAQTFWILSAYFVFINPVVEELFWRGLFYEQLKRFFKSLNTPDRWKHWPLAVSAFIFGAWHWVIIQHFFTPLWQIPLTLLIMVGGVTFGRAYNKNRSLTNAIILHGVGADLPIMMILWDCLHHS